MSHSLSLSPVFSALLAGPLLLASAHGQSVDDLEARLRDHPALQSLKWETEAVGAEGRAALGLPDPVVSLGINNLPVEDPAFDRFLPTHKAIGVRQDIPNLKSRRAGAAMSDGEAARLELMAEQRFAALRARLITALADRRRIIEQQNVLEAQAEALDALTETVEADLAAGRAVAFRLAQVDVERVDLSRRRADLAAEMAAVEAALIDLVGDVPQTDLPPIEPQQWIGEASAFHAVRLADAGIDIAAAGTMRAEAAYWPNWGVGLTYQQREEGSGLPGEIFRGDDWVSAQVTFTVPLWQRNNQDPKLRAAKAREAAARSDLATAARMAQAAWSRLDAARVAAEDSVDLLEAKIAGLAEQARAARADYEAGYGTYSSVIDAELAALELRSQLAAERARVIALTAEANSLLVTP
ncbi:heavy metal RND efflux outer membrane protein, CzcC family protein [Parvularcula bermudensis HTCC2503]|uniref:Heavy metal RND efflux outer membrane protein, CzcC family protein n=1 Tax=Parvularcula bermudensis (strain ATCC BAA-594 / HTCC2503 / KCTC 12087) TaxID=314260 RepID=E0THZ0_PARBH|nr:TolC family protein [Parvularcula bermudensis]ADM10801.1 heavy metal RND efflux outer membrane protein, CzcC family protein [Parvularcula bermudensis HTCC2503]